MQQWQWGLLDNYTSVLVWSQQYKTTDKVFFPLEKLEGSQTVFAIQQWSLKMVLCFAENTKRETRKVMQILFIFNNRGPET